jgi:hypothetical protein
MNCTETNELVKEMADLIRFHELETVDSKAVELLELADSIPKLSIEEDTESIDEYIETVRQANMVNTSR